jgi:two-component system response regulator AtoC
MRSLLIFNDPAAAATELRARCSCNSLAQALVSATPAREEVDKGLGLPILEAVNKAQRQAEADVILTALNATRWNRKQASALLKIDYKALLYKMKKLGMEEKPVDTPDDPPAMMSVGS